MSLFCFSVLDFQQNLADLTYAVLCTSRTLLQLRLANVKVFVMTALTEESLMKTVKPVKHTLFILK